jgi:hypothetical protein
MSDIKIRDMERKGELTLEALIRAGALVGTQVTTTEFGGQGGMHPGTWEVTEYTDATLGFGKVGQRGKLLKVGPGKRYRYSLESFGSPNRVFEQLGAALLTTAGRGYELAKSKRDRDNDREQTWVAYSAGTWRTMTKLCLVTATSKRKAQNLIKREYPGTTFSGQFGAHLSDDADILERARKDGLREVTA